MLSLSPVNPTTAQLDAKSAPKSADKAQESSGFSDVYEKSEENSGRPSDDLNETRKPDQDTGETAPKDTDSRPDKEGKQPDSDSRKDTQDAPEDADFVAVDVAETVEDGAEVPLRDRPVQAAKGTTENATMMKLAPQAADGRSQVKPMAPETPAETKPANDGKPTDPIVSVQEKPKGAQVSKLAMETAPGLDPMRVQVRASGAQPQQGVGQQQVVAEFAASDVGRRASAKLSADMVEEPTTPKIETPSVPTTSTTQQMQARAIMEQVNAGTQQMQNGRGAEIQASQNADVLVGASDEANNSSRSIVSVQEAASQARLNNSAPNPAYVVRQLADAAKMSDKNLIELAMDPPELGKVRMSMSEAAGVMTVNIAAENQATTELMRRHIDMLRKDFLELGFDDVAFNFEQNGRQGEQQAESGGEFGRGAGSGSGRASDADGSLLAEAGTLAAQQGRPQTVPTSGIDIRV